jgi:hypothetical protein
MASAAFGICQDKQYLIVSIDEEMKHNCTREKCVVARARTKDKSKGASGMVSVLT